MKYAIVFAVDRKFKIIKVWPHYKIPNLYYLESGDTKYFQKHEVFEYENDAIKEAIKKNKELRNELDKEIDILITRKLENIYRGKK